MNSEQKMTLKNDPILSQKYLLNFLSEQKYKKVPNWISYFLRTQWGFSKDQLNGVYVKLLFNFFPLWYIGYQFNQDKQLQIHFYTKGMSLLDIFGIRKKWDAEIKKIQNFL